MKETVILYHGSCLDGFAAAYAAWKKFGDTASYVAVFHNAPVPAGLEDKEVYIVDFSYPVDELLALETKAKKLVVLDHHIGSKDAVEQAREHIFDNNRSGAGIAWGYFHPQTLLPRALAYIQDNDLWQNKLPHCTEIAAYLSTAEFDFKEFDRIAEDFADDKKFEAIIEKGKVYGEYYNYACNWIAKQAEEVQFDEYKIFAVNAPRLFRSEVGQILAHKKGPFSITWYPHEGKWHFSLRGDGSVDLSAIAKKYGGSGHHDAASFRLDFDKPLPFARIKK